MSDPAAFVALAKSVEPRDKARNDFLLSQLDTIDVVAKIESEEEYSVARKVSEELCSLSCYTFNHQSPLNDRVWRMEGMWNREIARYTKRTYDRKDPDDICVANYAIGTKHFLNVNTQRDYYLSEVVPYLLSREMLANDPDDGKIVVLGLRKKVGDNVYSVDRRGNQHQQYVSMACPQAFYLADRYLAQLKDVVLPDMPEGTRTVYLSSGSGGKGSAKTPALARSVGNQLTLIFQRFNQSQQAA